jgi:hypothetical protein
MAKQTCVHCGMADKECNEIGKCSMCQDLIPIEDVIIESLWKQHYEKEHEINQLKEWNANQARSLIRLRTYLVQISKLIDYKQTGLDPNNFDDLVTQLQLILSDARQ